MPWSNCRNDGRICETALILYHNLIKRGITINKDFDEIPLVVCLKDEVVQIWMNLIHNALQAMNYEGSLYISIKQDKQMAKVSIRYTGSGMPKDIQSKIFMPFFTTKSENEGSGLGLDIVAKIIEKHQGEITFESEEGVGTTFHVYLPIGGVGSTR